MAEDKKGVLVYADWIEKFEDLEDDEAGRLIKHFFRYINDQNPEYPDRITKIAFTDIKNSLKRDLKKWEAIKQKRSDAGKASAESKKAKQLLTESTCVEFDEITLTKPTDNVNVSVSVNENVSVSDVDESTRAFSPSSTLFGIGSFKTSIIIGINDFTHHCVKTTGRTISDIENFVDIFLVECRAKSKLSWQNETDAKSHFINWIKKQPKSNISKFGNGVCT